MISSTEHYQSLKYLLDMATSAEAGSKQPEINKLFSHFTQLPNPEDYLVTFVQDSTMPLVARSMGAWLLKTQIKQRGLLLERQRNDLVRVYLEEPEKALCTVLSLLYAQAAQTGKEWPELLPRLLTQEQPLRVLPVLEMICQDSPDSIVSSEEFPNLLEFLLESVRIGEGEAGMALACINQLIIFPSSQLEERLGRIMESLSVLAGSPNVQVQKRVLECLSSLTYSYPHEMIQVMPSVMDFMLRVLEAHGDPVHLETFEENLALDACDFWMTLVEREGVLYEGFAEQINELVRGHLARLLPVLLKAMTYAEDDLELQENVEGNVMLPDDLCSMLPRHHKNNGQEEEEEEEEELDEYGSSGWSLRKCAGNTLDRLAGCVFGDSEEVVQGGLIPLINEKFSASHRDWRLLESGIMAIGAIAEGASGVLAPQIPQLVDFLLVREGRLPLVRATAAWTLSRLNLGSGKTVRKVIDFLSQSILVEGSKRVQRVSIVFLQNVLSRHPLAWKAQDIVHLVLQAAPVCQLRNRVQLCDLLTFVADEQGFGQVEDRVFLAMLHFILDFWALLPRELVFPVVEAVSAVSTAAGERIPRQAAELIYEKCVNDIYQILQLEQTVDQEEYLVALLDVITGLFPTKAITLEALRGFEERVLYPLFTNYNTPAILQSMFGFIGDALKYHYQGTPKEEKENKILSNEYFQGMEAIIAYNKEEEEEEWMATRNNAVWALGEAIHHGIYQPTTNLVCLLQDILVHEHHASSGLLDNAAVCLGRCCLVAGRNDDDDNNFMSELYKVLGESCVRMALGRVVALPDGQERESSLLGLSSLHKL